MIVDYFPEVIDCWYCVPSAWTLPRRVRFHKISYRVCTQKNNKDLFCFNVLLGWAWCLVGFEGSYFPFCCGFTILVFVHGCIIDINCFFTWQAAESLSSNETESFSYGNSVNRVVKNFSLDTVLTLTTYLPSGNYFTTIARIGEILNINLLLAFFTLIYFFKNIFLLRSSVVYRWQY